MGAAIDCWLSKSEHSLVVSFLGIEISRKRRINEVPINVRILTYLSGHFSGGRPIRRDSQNTYEFLAHQTVCRKRYENLRLWLEPNQKTVVC